MAELSTIARPYAEALFRVAVDDRDGASLADWSKEVGALSAVAADPAMQALIGDPRVEPAALYDVFAGVLGEKPTPKIENLVRTLIANDRLVLMPEIAAQFDRLVQAKEGSATAEITSAFPMSDVDVASLVASLEKRFSIRLEPAVSVDEGLIGGVRVVVGDRVLDTSVRSRLEQMRTALAA